MGVEAAPALGRVGRDAVIAVGPRPSTRASSERWRAEPAGRWTAQATRSIVSAISARDGDDGFLDELFHAAQRADSGVPGVDGADAAGMAGAPGFQEVERFAPRTSPMGCGRGAGVAARNGRDRRARRRRPGPHGDEVGRGGIAVRAYPR